MVKRSKKKNQKKIWRSSSEELSSLERELFLNAFYQGEIKPEKKAALPLENKKETILDESELFLHAVSHGVANAEKLDKEEETLRQERKVIAKKRDVIDATIDLHGMFAEDAINVLLKFIDREKRRGSKSLLVIHGKGAGILKNAVQSIIGSHPEVENWIVPSGKLGGQGAIIVRLAHKKKSMF